MKACIVHAGAPAFGCRDCDRASTCLTPHDGRDIVRPHTIPGWWQVWSGGICIALLRPEDVEPLRAALNESEDKP